jgi:hypothetical protein
LRNAARFRTPAMIDAYLGLYERVVETRAGELSRPLQRRSLTVTVR